MEKIDEMGIQRPKMESTDKEHLGIFENKKLAFQFAGINCNFFTYGNYHYSKKNQMH